MSVNTKMTAIADEIRELSGTTDTMGLDAMASNLDEANTEVASQSSLINDIVAALEGKAAGGDEQATPVINIDSNGLITATAGTKSATKQLAFQAAKTITPSTVSQIAVSSGYYTGGDITVAGDSNLVAGNIKSGVSIFGVTGTASGDNSGSGSVSQETITIVNNLGVTCFCGASYIDAGESIQIPLKTKNNSIGIPVMITNNNINNISATTTSGMILGELHAYTDLSDNGTSMSTFCALILIMSITAGSIVTLNL